jgi:hypothetical protein
MIMQQYLEKSFPMAADLSEREVDLLAYQVQNLTLSRQVSGHLLCNGDCSNKYAGVLKRISQAHKVFSVEPIAKWLLSQGRLYPQG